MQHGAALLPPPWYSQGENNVLGKRSREDGGSERKTNIVHEMTLDTHQETSCFPSEYISSGYHPLRDAHQVCRFDLSMPVVLRDPATCLFQDGSLKSTRFTKSGHYCLLLYDRAAGLNRSSRISCRADVEL